MKPISSTRTSLSVKKAVGCWIWLLGLNPLGLGVVRWVKVQGDREQTAHLQMALLRGGVRGPR